MKIWTVEEPPFVYSFWSTAGKALKSLRRYRQVGFLRSAKLKVIAHTLDTDAFTKSRRAPKKTISPARQKRRRALIS